MTTRLAEETAKAVYQRMQQRIKQPSKMWGIAPWWSPTLNEITGGIQPGEMAILTARPSVGKTQDMVQEADSVASYIQRKGKAGKVKLVLAESSDEVFIRRWACYKAGVSQRRVLDGSIAKYPDKLAAFEQALRDFKGMPIEFLAGPQTLDEIVRFLAQDDTYWWALDHVQKCPLTLTRPNDNSVGSLTIISNALSNLARDYAPGLVLAHTPREVDKREDRRPRMGDIKGASVLEGDARKVLGMYRERVYQRVPEEEANRPHPAELLVLKDNETGGEGRVIDLIFNPRKGRFEDVTKLMNKGDEDE